MQKKKKSVGEIKQKSLEVQMQFIKNFHCPWCSEWEPNEMKRIKKRCPIALLCTAHTIGPCPMKFAGDGETASSHPIAP